MGTQCLICLTSSYQNTYSHSGVFAATWASYEIYLPFKVCLLETYFSSLCLYIFKAMVLHQGHLVPQRTLAMSGDTLWFSQLEQEGSSNVSWVGVSSSVQHSIMHKTTFNDKKLSSTKGQQ